MTSRGSQSDGYFLGKIPPIFYNFSFETTRHAYMNLVFDAAMDTADALVPRENCGDWLLRNKPGQPLQIPNPLYPELGGLTRMDWVEQQLPGMANSGDYHVVEKWSLHRDYRFGIGLHATIDVPFLTIKAVIAF
ncbi:MAG: hypothetical protein HQL78_12385, partial [Magnetococcales bacterium]|nr:hypothetical protein [Magnetococcales bacterium]